MKGDRAERSTSRLPSLPVYCNLQRTPIEPIPMLRPVYDDASTINSVSKRRAVPITRSQDRR